MNGGLKGVPSLLRTCIEAPLNDGGLKEQLHELASLMLQSIVKAHFKVEAIYSTRLNGTDIEGDFDGGSKGVLRRGASRGLRSFNEDPLNI